MLVHWLCNPAILQFRIILGDSADLQYCHDHMYLGYLCTDNSARRPSSGETNSANTRRARVPPCRPHRDGKQGTSLHHMPCRGSILEFRRHGLPSVAHRGQAIKGNAAMADNATSVRLSRGGLPSANSVEYNQPAATDIYSTQQRTMQDIGGWHRQGFSLPAEGEHGTGRLCKVIILQQRQDRACISDSHTTSGNRQLAQGGSGRSQHTTWLALFWLPISRWRPRVNKWLKCTECCTVITLTSPRASL